MRQQQQQEAKANGWGGGGTFFGGLKRLGSKQLQKNKQNTDIFPKLHDKLQTTTINFKTTSKQHKKQHTINTNNESKANQLQNETAQFRKTSKNKKQHKNTHTHIFF